MGVSGVPTRNAIIAEAKRQIRDLEGRLQITRESIETLEKASFKEAVAPEVNMATFQHIDRIERMLEAVVVVQLIALRGNMVEGQIKLDEMSAGVAKAESPIQTGHSLPHPPNPRRF